MNDGRIVQPGRDVHIGQPANVAFHHVDLTGRSALLRMRPRYSRYLAIHDVNRVGAVVIVIVAVVDEGVRSLLQQFCRQTEEGLEIAVDLIVLVDEDDLVLLRKGEPVRGVFAVSFK